jgi:DnaJ domain
MTENSMAKIKTHYDNLNVSQNAPAFVIRAAYKVLCQNYHPDKYAGGPEEALRLMKIINGSYAVLSDSDKRAEHDQWINMRERARAIDEAQRMMRIFTKTYVAPSVTDQRASIGNAFLPTTLMSSYFRCCKRWAKKPAHPTRLWITGVIGIVLIAFILYAPDLKTTSNGTAVAKDYKQAAALFHKAAKQGLAEAIVALKKVESEK